MGARRNGTVGVRRYLHTVGGIRGSVKGSAVSGSLQLRLIHTPGVWWQGRKLSVTSSRTLPLLAYVALSQSEVNRQDLVDALWADGKLVNLRQELSKIRRLPGADEWFRADAASAIQVLGKSDVAHLRALFSREEYGLVTELWTGRRGMYLLSGLNLDSLPAPYHDWLGEASREVEEVFAESFRQLALQLEAQGDLAAALQAFSSNEHNPGRANLWHLGQGSLMLDYGHNPDAFRHAAELSAGWNGPVIAIAGVPGDRADSVIAEAARALADGFSRLWIKEDGDLRGRQRGEVAELIWRTVRERNHEVDCRIVLDEVDALEAVLEEVMAGAHAILFFERREPVLEVLRKAGARPADALPSDHPEHATGIQGAWQAGPVA